MPRLVVFFLIAAWMAVSGAPTRAAGPAGHDASAHEPFLLSMPDLSSPRATLNALLTAN